MPLQFRIPLPESHPTFASRARKRGLGFLLTQERVALPGPNVFVRSRGMGVITAQKPVLFPGPNVFLRSKGMGAFVLPHGVGAFCIQADPPPVFPGRNIFAKFQMGKNCASCARPCRRQGMGQDDGMSASLFETSPSSTDLISPTMPTLEGPGFETSPTSTTLISPTSSSYGGLVASTNPALDAYNQALTNSLGNGQSTSQAIAAAAAAAAKAGASIAQISQLSGSASKSIAATPTTAPPSGYQWTYSASTNKWTLTPTTTGQITTWLSNNVSTVAVVGLVAIGAAILASGKGKR